MILAKSERSLILVEHVDRPYMEVDNVGVNFDLEMGEHINAPEMSTPG